MWFEAILIRLKLKNLDMGEPLQLDYTLHDMGAGGRTQIKLRGTFLTFLYITDLICHWFRSGVFKLVYPWKRSSLEKQNKIKIVIIIIM